MDGKKNRDSLKVLAAQTLKIASINGLGAMEKLETELEDEIRWEESRRPPSEIFGRFRRRCEEVLHSKPMLLFIVVLNIVDCLLVMGELTLDFHHVSNKYLAQKSHTESFLEKMKRRYDPLLDDLQDVEDDHLTALFDRFLSAFIFWDASNYTAAGLAADCAPVVANYSSAAVSSSDSNVLLSLLAAGSGSHEMMGQMDRQHYDAEKIAHALHYASISILSFLLAETILKIACVGKRFIKKRMEVFDAVIIVVSFTLDIVFVEGLTTLDLQHFVIILSFLLPWRILRVLNSLVVAVMDQHRFHLKLLYKQKRKINKQYQEASDNIKMLETQLETLKGLCKRNGVSEREINSALGQTLTANGHGGLKALSKLVFHAAESFAPLTGSPQINGSMCFPLTADSASSASVSFQCNGDVEHGSSSPSPSNGHVVHVLQEDSRVEDETRSSSGSKEERGRDEGDGETSAEGPHPKTVDGNHSEDKDTTEGELMKDPGQEEGRTNQDAIPSSSKFSVYLPEEEDIVVYAEGGRDGLPCVNEATSVTRL